ncbi:MAG: hypothetical protein H6970_11435 [Gammaproteobacteria bacterium]|nr:hypothetical protein [Gammaproteobacteria bacterium]MCP5425659.1 hypothetical protein [Gammaproteobacteria bacterium]
MINKLVVNRFLTIPVFDQSPPSPDPTFPADFVRALGRIYNIEESETSGPLYNRAKTSQISVGGHATKAHRTFRWLPWVLGKVSCVPLAGADILTGTMSGCWLVIFQYNGKSYAGHIGTDTSATSANTLQARAAWRNAVNGNVITPVKAFNPVGNSLPALGTLNIKTDSPEFYGAFTANGDVYTVVFGAPGHGGSKRRIARVVKMPTTQDVTAF